MVTNCDKLKLVAKDGKKYLTDVLKIEYNIWGSALKHRGEKV